MDKNNRFGVNVDVGYCANCRQQIRQELLAEIEASFSKPHLKFKRNTDYSAEQSVYFISCDKWQALKEREGL